MKPAVKILLLCALAFFSTNLRAEESRQLSYEPTVVTLAGTIVEQRYGKDSSPMDRGTSVWILRLDKPVSVAADPNNELSVEEKNVREIHLNVDRTVHPVARGAFGKTHFTVTGTLYHAHTIHHLRPIVMTVSELSADGSTDAAWKTYTDPRLGCSLQYPASLVAGDPPAEDTGFEFHTANNEFTVTVLGGRHRGSDDHEYIDLTWQSELAALGNTITYKKKADGWFVVSGVGKAGVEYYRKVIAQDGAWRAFVITYPHAKNQRYDPWVERIAKTFAPFAQ